MKIADIYNTPLFELISKAHRIHIENHPIGQMQICSLVSFKTGGCPEDCKYCPQSSRYKTGVSATKPLTVEEVCEMAEIARARGATRICIGSAWREIKEGKIFDVILECVQKITAMGLEVCCTLGMLTEAQAKRLKEAGLYAYNHNLDSSERFYKTIISTRTYGERLETLANIRKSGITVCCGGILGMGETPSDRIAFIETLVPLKPESVPINFLIPIPGTPLEKQPRLPIWEALRMIATLRIALPSSKIRIAAGRSERSFEEQALCFFAGANSIFAGDVLLTAANPSRDEDAELFETLGLNKCTLS